jgi:hypothetical protein
MAERNDARRSIEASRSHLTDIAEELSRRTSGDYLKDRAREAAMARASRAREIAITKATDVRTRAASNPAALGTLGAVAGGALGLALGKKAKNRREAESYYEYGGGFRTEGSYVSRDYIAQPAYTPSPDYVASPEVSTVGAESWSEPWRSTDAQAAWATPEYERYGARTQWEPEGPSRGERLKEKASEMKGRAGERASDLKERVAHKASDVKHRIQERRETSSQGPGRFENVRHRAAELRENMPSGTDLRQRASHLRERMPSGPELRQRAQERPAAPIVGSIILGAIAASLLPLTRRERKVMHPAKERARSQFGDQFHRIEERFGMRGEQQQQQSRDWNAQNRGWQESRENRGSNWDESGQFASTSSPSGGTFSAGTAGTSYSTTGVGAPTSREVGTRYGSATSNVNEDVYRQPSLDQQLDQSEDDKFH